MSAMAFQITSLTIVYSTVYSVTDQRKHQSTASLAFVRGIHRWPVNSPHKGPVKPKIVSIWWRHHDPVSSSHRDQDLCWIISRPNKNERIRVVFDDFTLQTSSNCEMDYLEIRDGKFSLNLGWGNLFHSSIFLIFQTYQNTGYLWNITFIFGRCLRSLPAVTFVKYGCDLKNLTQTFASSKFPLTEKLTNGVLVTPTRFWTIPSQINHSEM